jgi:6-phosphogluconolactonase (cycloisomerase 2 family)
MKKLWRVALLAGAVAACGDQTTPLGPDVSVDEHRAHKFDRSPGAVYTMTNAADGNEILIFNRSADGTLEAAGAVATGGLGTGGGLGNQGGVGLGWGNRNLYAVNAGSNEISVFRVGSHGLRLIQTIESGGERPISLAVHRNLLYVLHGADGGSVTGFRVTWFGGLRPIHGSTRPLSGAETTDPAQVSFSPDGRTLVVTEKATNMIVTYRVRWWGLLGEPEAHESAGQTPFGFAFARRNLLLVSEAFGGAPDASTLSSYAVGNHGFFKVLDPAVATTETAACWVVVTGNGRFAYTTNTGSGSISGFKVGHRGDLELLDMDGVTASTGAGPIDMAFSRNSRYLYALNSGDGSLSIFGVGSDGSLESVGDIPGLPAGTNGLAAF